MIVPQSELKLAKFDILSAEIGFIGAVNIEDEIDPSTYVVDLDFDITVEEGGPIVIVTTVDVSGPNAESPCHVLHVVGGSVFEIESDDEVDSEIMDHHIQNTGLAAAFHNMRGFILNATSYLPIGAYTLPLFPTHQLMNMKYGNGASE